MIFNDLAELFNDYSKKIGELMKKDKQDEALKVMDEFEKEATPYLNSCEMTMADFKNREQFNTNLRNDSISGYENAKTFTEKKECATMYNMAQKELFELWTTWKTIVGSFQEQLKQLRMSILTKPKKS